jgi:hypothetical protein
MMRPVRFTGSPSLISLAPPEQHRAHALLFEVERDAEHALPELEHLARHGALDAVDAGDAVADRDHAADFGDVDLDGVAAQLVANDLGDFVRSDVHVVPSASCVSRGPLSGSPRAAPSTSPAVSPGCRHTP